MLRALSQKKGPKLAHQVKIIQFENCPRPFLRAWARRPHENQAPPKPVAQHSGLTCPPCLAPSLLPTLAHQWMLCTVLLDRHSQVLQTIIPVKLHHIPQCRSQCHGGRRFPEEPRLGHGSCSTALPSQCFTTPAPVLAQSPRRLVPISPRLS